MKYLLDTDVIVDHLRAAKKLETNLIQSGAGISIITYGELLYGAEKGKDTNKQKKIIHRFIDKLEINVFNLTTDIISNYAVLKAKLEKKGKDWMSLIY
jgi:predicted nucleic acid-binding protein